MKRGVFVLVGSALLLLSACLPQKTVCPQSTGTPQHLMVPPEMLPTSIPEMTTGPILVGIGGRSVLVDRVVEGPLCNDTWSGTVYVACNVQVYAWEETPDFLKNCNLKIEPDTVVYVANHNDTAYYNGCSCHTDEIAGP